MCDKYEFVTYDDIDSDQNRISRSQVHVSKS